jgi:16S rRNA (uracil1498-N3)-methyltransferase
LVIEKATELGVNRIEPFFSACTVAQVPQERQGERLARWQRLARSAAKQSGNPFPLITTPRPLRDLLATVPDGVGKVLLYEKEATLSLKAFARTHPAFSSLWVVIGPEGGFAPAEIAQARATGFQTVGLGTRVVRAETAAIIAVALCQFLWGEEQLPLLPLRRRMP